MLSFSWVDKANCSQTSFPTISSLWHLNSRALHGLMLGGRGSIWFLVIIIASWHLLSHILSHLLCRLNSMQGAVGMSHTFDCRSSPVPAPLGNCYHPPIRPWKCLAAFIYWTGTWETLWTLWGNERSFNTSLLFWGTQEIFLITCRTWQFPIFAVVGGYTSSVL